MSVEAAPAPLRVRVVEGSGAAIPAQSTARARFVVAVEDASGRPVAGAAVTFRLPARGPSATFSSGLKTEVFETGADGKASVGSLRGNSFQGPFQIQVEAVAGGERAEASIAAEVRPPATETASKIQPVITRRPSSSNKKWLLLGTVIAGGAAGALMAMRGGSAAAAQPVTPPIVIPTVGAPTIGVTRP